MRFWRWLGWVQVERASISCTKYTSSFADANKFCIPWRTKSAKAQNYCNMESNFSHSSSNEGRFAGLLVWECPKSITHLRSSPSWFGQIDGDTDQVFQVSFHHEWRKQLGVHPCFPKALRIIWWSNSHPFVIPFPRVWRQMRTLFNVSAHLQRNSNHQIWRLVASKLTFSWMLFPQWIQVPSLYS